MRGYYAAVAHGAATLDWDHWFTADVVQEEFPNRLLPEQAFELFDVLASGDKVVVEAEWRGTVGRDIGPFTAGMRLRTRFAQVLELRMGKIAALRNYDCFYPW